MNFHRLFGSFSDSQKCTQQHQNQMRTQNSLVGFRGIFRFTQMYSAAPKLDANSDYSWFLGNFQIHKDVSNSTKIRCEFRRGIFRFTKMYVIAPKLDANSEYGSFQGNFQIHKNVCSSTKIGCQFRLQYLGFMGIFRFTKMYAVASTTNSKLLYNRTNMWSPRSAIERCPSPQNQIRFRSIVTDNGREKGNDIFRFSSFIA